MKTSLIKIISTLAFSLIFGISISAQDNLQKGIELYKSGKFTQSIKALKKVKKNEKDWELYRSHTHQKLTRRQKVFQMV